MYAFIQYIFNTKRFDVLLNNFKFFLLFNTSKTLNMKKALEMDKISAKTMRKYKCTCKCTKLIII